MDFRVLDKDFNVIGLLNVYKSLIWTVRFMEAGDFELITPINMEVLSTIKVGNYLFCSEFYDSETKNASLMIVETIEITTKENEENEIKITGRDLKSILERRIVWGQKTFLEKDNIRVSEMIETLLYDNIVNPPDWSQTYQDSYKGDFTIYVNGGQRAIPNLVYNNVVNHKHYPTITTDYQYNGDNLYDIITSLLTEYNLGLEILFNTENNTFIMSLKEEVDKTYDQVDNPPIIFSPGLQNLSNSNYLESSVSEKNTALIAGNNENTAEETEGTSQHTSNYYNVVDTGISGMDRREIFINASDLTRKDESTGREVGNRTYTYMLESRGKTELANYEYSVLYEGEVTSYSNYKYLKDYNVGDICEIVNEWGFSSVVLLSEVVLSSSEKGTTLIPTFISITNKSKWSPDYSYFEDYYKDNKIEPVIPPDPPGPVPPGPPPEPGVLKVIIDKTVDKLWLNHS